jgi:hypothetical protein
MLIKSDKNMVTALPIGIVFIVFLVVTDVLTWG